MVNIFVRAKKATFLQHTISIAILKNIIHLITERKKQGKKSFALLVDPDKVDNEKIDRLVEDAVDAGVDFIFVGGSLVISNYTIISVLNIKHCYVNTSIV